eukprot:139519-Lingulodinium_polyedra.AAC.1
MGTAGADSGSSRCTTGVRSGASKPASVARPPLTDPAGVTIISAVAWCPLFSRSLPRWAVANATDS